MVDLLAEVVEALVELVELCLLAFNVRAVLLELAGQGVGACLGPLQVLLSLTEQELLGLELGAHGLWGKIRRKGFSGVSHKPGSCHCCHLHQLQQVHWSCRAELQQCHHLWKKTASRITW